MQASNQGFFDVVAQRLGATALTPEQRRRMLARPGAPAAARAGRPAPSATTSCAEDVTLMLRMLGATTRPAPDGSPMAEHWPRYVGLLLDACGRRRRRRCRPSRGA